jgi:hypothetical protein
LRSRKGFNDGTFAAKIQAMALLLPGDCLAGWGAARVRETGLMNDKMILGSDK